MFQQIDAQPYDVLLHGLPRTDRPSDRPGDRTTSSDVVADQDVPMFALLRSTRGLPVDDRRWWPSGGRHVLVTPEVYAAAHGPTTPTTALLERALAGLRAWDATGGVDTPREAGRHALG